MYLLLAACGPAADPLAALDQDYAEILMATSAADRDTARNVHNRHARARRTAAEAAKAEFFRDPKRMAAIDAARKAKDPATLARGEAWWRASLVARSWTAADTAEETRLVEALDEIAAQRGEWFTPGGEVRADLTRAWNDASRAVDHATPEVQDSLAEAWLQHRMAVVAPELSALVRLRNEVARREGFSNYWELSITAEGLTPAEVDEAVARLSEVVRPAEHARTDKLRALGAELGIVYDFTREPLLRRRAGVEAARDQADSAMDGDLAEERVFSFYQDLGISPASWEVYTGPRTTVRSGVYGFLLRPPDQVAIVMSRDDRFAIWPYEALAHEAGHAVWWSSLSSIDLASPLRWEPAAPYFEGFAQFFERLAFEPAFLERYVPELPAADRAGLSDWRRQHVGEWVADAIVDTMVERRLYESPDDLAGLAQFAATTRSELTGGPAAPTTSAGVFDPSLISTLLWHYPGYAQNYLFAYRTEAAIYGAVEAAVGPPLGNSKVGPFLVKALIQGDPALSFAQRLEKVAGGDLYAPLQAYIGH